MCFDIQRKPEHEQPSEEAAEHHEEAQSGTRFAAGPGPPVAAAAASLPAAPSASELAFDGAARGTSGPAEQLPHFDAIQRAFGRHDVSAIQAHTGQSAREGARAMGAQAFAHGNHVAFGKVPDLHTAAHEAAHVIQQRSGVHLKGGVGETGDAYERHADAVADRVVAGASAESLLDEMVPSGGAAGTGVQMAGHAGVMIFGTAGGRGTVLKRVEKTEADQYRRVRLEQNSRDQAVRDGALGTFPVVYGVYTGFAIASELQGQYDATKLNGFLGKHDDVEDWYVEMASVKDDRNDAIKDFKIGTHTTNAAELVAHGHKDSAKSAAAKVEREDIADKLTESRTYGLRDSDEMRKASKGAGIWIGKNVGSSRDFLSADTLGDVRGKVKKEGGYPIDSVVFKDLDHIERYIRASNTVYVASSLIMNWCADRMWRETNDTIRLIDLAHPIAQGEDGFAEAKDGMLLGIQNLRRILEGEGLETKVKAMPQMEANPLRAG